MTFSYTKSPIGTSPRVVPVITGITGQKFRPIKPKIIEKPLVSKKPPVSKIIEKPPVVYVRKQGIRPVTKVLRSESRKFPESGNEGVKKSLRSGTEKLKNSPDSLRSVSEKLKTEETSAPNVTSSLPKMKITFGKDGKLSSIMRERENGLVERVPFKPEKERRREKVQKKIKEEIVDEEYELQSEITGRFAKEKREKTPECHLGPFVPSEDDNPMGKEF